jgi:hypothetical protein
MTVLQPLGRHILATRTVLFAVALSGALQLVRAEAPAPTPLPDRPLVGAIRWDGWFAGNPWERNLAPEQWHSRLPFYAKVTADGVEVRSDSQEVMDREIGYAADAGLDFWAFCYYHPASWPGADEYNYGWKLYLASKQKQRPKFCLLLQGGSHLGPKGAWSATVAELVSRFKEPTYQRVAGGRPLLFVFACEHVEPHFGSAAEARKAFDELRAQSREAGAGDPYVVAQVFSAADGAGYVDRFGWDALSAYSAPGGGEHKELPYRDLAATNHWYWEQFEATGKPVIPTVNTGWDGRPRLTDPQYAQHYRGPWYTMPTPAELAAHVGDTLKWVRANRSACPADAVLLYAWNENDEGGWLVPTLAEGNARLEALREVLHGREP